MRDDIKQQVRELIEDNKNLIYTNRQLLKSLTDQKYENAVLQMVNQRLEAEIQKMKGEEDHDK